VTASEPDRGVRYSLIEHYLSHFATNLSHFSTGRSDLATVAYFRDYGTIPAGEIFRLFVHSEG
jgi:hypothetical protein